MLSSALGYGSEMDDSTCSSRSLALGEPLAATASEASAWLLIEQPGAWGRKALRESRLDPRVGAELERRAKELGIKALLIKRPGRGEREVDRRTVLLGRSDQGAAWLEQAAAGDEAALLELDLERLAAGGAGHGEPVAGPVYLVCTNGRRDACCASLGRPVAAALAAARPGQVWECSHVGGHRFAANVVCLPDGVWYGRLTPADALLVANGYERGRLHLAHLRGRSSFPVAAQAADALVRARDRLDALDALVLERCEASNGGAVVRFRAPSGRVEVEVRSTPDGVARPYSCGDAKEETPVTWALAG
jgi:hypothetical protein